MWLHLHCEASEKEGWENMLSDSLAASKLVCFGLQTARFALIKLNVLLCIRMNQEPLMPSPSKHLLSTHHLQPNVGQLGG